MSKRTARMSDPLSSAVQKNGQVLYEVVAYRFSDERGIMLVGEAEVMVERLPAEAEGGGPPDRRYRIRVDVLSAFDPEGRDCFKRVMADEALRQAVEAVAFEHFLLPPQVPVSLPSSRVEWGKSG